MTALSEAVRELAEWWQRRRHPRPVATFGHPTYLDEQVWAHAMTSAQLRRQARRYERLDRKGLLRGENRVRARAIRHELGQRVRAADSSPMDALSRADRGFIRHHLRKMP